jgi:Tol biopolymer transport system component
MNQRKNILWIAGLFVPVCGLAACILAVFFVFKPSMRAAPAYPPLVFPTRDIKTPTASLLPVASTSPSIDQSPTGKIVYVCQVERSVESDQLCIVNPDGSGQRQLTFNYKARHYYPSITPDGASILFSSNMGGKFEIYQMLIETGQLIRLGQTGVAPDASPDGTQIAFTQSDGKGDAVWVMDRNGRNSRLVHSPGWDPSWSPDGQFLLFASYAETGETQLMIIRPDGAGLKQVTNLPLLRGRSDWSNDGLWMITYSGRSWERELFIFSPDGTNPRQLTSPGGNSQGPSFSPDGQWVAFTAYFDNFRNVNGCEIYAMRIDGTSLTRLTQNNYCDWQPRWGP